MAGEAQTELQTAIYWYNIFKIRQMQGDEHWDELKSDLFFSHHFAQIY